MARSHLESWVRFGMFNMYPDQSFPWHCWFEVGRDIRQCVFLPWLSSWCIPRVHVVFVELLESSSSIQSCDHSDSRFYMRELTRSDSLSSICIQIISFPGIIMKLGHFTWKRNKMMYFFYLGSVHDVFQGHVLFLCR